MSKPREIKEYKATIIENTKCTVCSRKLTKDMICFEVIKNRVMCEVCIDTCCRMLDEARAQKKGKTTKTIVGDVITIEEKLQTSITEILKKKSGFGKMQSGLGLPNTFRSSQLKQLQAKKENG